MRGSFEGRNTLFPANSVSKMVEHKKAGSVARSTTQNEHGGYHDQPSGWPPCSFHVAKREDERKKENLQRFSLTLEGSDGEDEESNQLMVVGRRSVTV
jgi:hypothetical protein